jgi:Uma2 family endonuclease
MSAVPLPNPIPPLENGDQLTRPEFERRYDAMPHVNKAELIEGVVYIPSPVRVGHHGTPHADFMTWLGTYRASTPVVSVAGNATVRLDMSNEPQPDGLMFLLPEYGGQVRISADDYVEGAPELVGEVSASTASIDLNAKFRAYQRNGVRECVVWRTLDRTVDWFVLRDRHFVPLAPGADGILRSEVFPGLWLDPAALVRLDLAAVLRVLQRGLDSPEHAAFVERLQRAGNVPL